MKFTKNLKLSVAIAIAVLLIFLVAFCDGLPYPSFFWVFAFALPIIASIFYAIITKKILNGCLIFFSWFILLAAGLEDLFFYIIYGPIPKSMFHLYDEPWMSWVARTLGLETVTPFSLIVSVILGVIVIAVLVISFRFLRNKKWWPKWL